MKNLYFYLLVAVLGFGCGRVDQKNGFTICGIKIECTSSYCNAIKAKNEDIIKTFLKRPDLDKKNSLETALKTNDPKIVKLIIDNTEKTEVKIEHLMMVLKDQEYNKSKTIYKRIVNAKRILERNPELKNNSLFINIKCKSWNERKVLNTIIKDLDIITIPKCIKIEEDEKIEEQKFIEDIEKTDYDKSNLPKKKYSGYSTDIDESEYENREEGEKQLSEIDVKELNEQLFADFIKPRPKKDYSDISLKSVTENDVFTRGFLSLGYIKAFNKDIILIGTGHAYWNKDYIKKIFTKNLIKYAQATNKNINVIYEGRYCALSEELVYDKTCQFIDKELKKKNLKNIKAYEKDFRHYNIFRTYNDHFLHNDLIRFNKIFQEFYEIKNRTHVKIKSDKLIRLWKRFTRYDILEKVIYKIEKYLLSDDKFSKYINIENFEHFKKLCLKVNAPPKGIYEKQKAKKFIGNYLKGLVFIMLKLQDYMLLYHVYKQKNADIIILVNGRSHVRNIYETINDSQKEYPLNENWNYNDDEIGLIPNDPLIYVGNLQNKNKNNNNVPKMPQILIDIFKNIPSNKVIEKPTKTKTSLQHDFYLYQKPKLKTTDIIKCIVEDYTKESNKQHPHSNVANIEELDSSDIKSKTNVSKQQKDVKNKIAKKSEIESKINDKK